MNAPFRDIFERQSRAVLWVETIALIGLMGWIDYITGYDMSFFLFYSFPILMMVRYADRRSAVVSALMCGVVWAWADFAAGHPYRSWQLQIWETAMRLTYFLLVAVAGSSLRSYIELLDRSRLLEQEIIRISEREQQRIGRDLHDGLCQYFAAVGCAAGSLKQRLVSRRAEETEEAAEIEELIMQGVSQTRGLARGLFPVEDDEAGLQSALKELAANATKLLNMQCIFECPQPIALGDNAAATHLFRIAQEALNNATRHGLANTATIRLEEHPDEVRLTIQDDGIGVPEPLPTSRGLGLSIMQYRARMIGAQFELARHPAGGTVVRCSFFPPHTKDPA